MGQDITLTLQMYGLAIIVSMFVAVMIWGIVLGLEWLHRKPEKQAAEPAPAPAAEAPAESAAGDIAAIAAAVYAMLGAVRIVRIEDATRARSWTNAGRLLHHATRPDTQRSRH